MILDLHFWREKDKNYQFLNQTISDRFLLLVVDCINQSLREISNFLFLTVEISSEMYDKDLDR